jgi:hypothetical protein
VTNLGNRNKKKRVVNTWLHVRSSKEEPTGRLVGFYAVNSSPVLVNPYHSYHRFDVFPFQSYNTGGEERYTKCKLVSRLHVLDVKDGSVNGIELVN